MFYHYINKEILKDKLKEEKTAYDIDLWGTNSTDYSKINTFTDKLLSTERFEIISLDVDNNIKKNKENLQVGDLLYRKINYDKKIDGNVEFYIGNNKIVSWGRIHRTYTINKDKNT